MRRIPHLNPRFTRPWWRISLLAKSSVILIVTIGTGRALGAEARRGELQGAPWVRHVIDAEGRGADGTKLADINGDGWLDIASGWEEDGTTRVYLNPGPRGARDAWRKVIVGATPSAEDAVFVDLDGDGNVDVVSSTEGDSRRVFVQWAPARDRLLDPSAWRQDVFPAVAGMTRWMFAEPIQFDGRNGIDLVVGGRRWRESPRSLLGWLEAPPRPRDVAAWKFHPLSDAGWIMTIDITDMDGDGDADILFSDRLEKTRGIYWLENPGADATASGAAWVKHTVGATNVHEVLLLGLGDLDGDGLRDIAAPVALGKTEEQQPDKQSRIAWYRRLDASGARWSEHMVPVPANTGNVKSVAIGDVDLDGRADLVVSCENARGERVGVYWLRADGPAPTAHWKAFDISGAPGIKFDIVRLLDLDGDGDLDVLSNEEQEAGRGLGVMWYENPGRVK